MMLVGRMVFLMKLLPIDCLLMTDCSVIGWLRERDVAGTSEEFFLEMKVFLSTMLTLNGVSERIKLRPELLIVERRFSHIVLASILTRKSDSVNG